MKRHAAESFVDAPQVGCQCCASIQFLLKFTGSALKALELFELEISIAVVVSCVRCLLKLKRVRNTLRHIIAQRGNLLCCIVKRREGNSNI